MPPSARSKSTRPPAAASTRQRVDLREVLSLIERAYLVWALVEARGNRTRAADRLRLPRATFIDRMRHHGLMSYLAARRARRLLAAELDR